MSNLEAARVALQAELDHAKTGHAFYAERIASLEQALVQISSLGGGRDAKAPAPKAKAKRGRKPNATKLAAAAQPANSDDPTKPAKPAKKAMDGKAGTRGRPRKEAANTHELPFTGGDYWTDLVTTVPQFGPDILASGISKLGFEPTEAQRKVLANRMAPALAALVKSGKIADSGKGRLHRYFKT